MTSKAFRASLAGVLFVAGLGYGLALRSFTARPEEGPRSLAFLTRVAESINPLFPRQVDADTEITRVSALEGVFVYHYRFVKVAASDLDQKVLSQLRPTVTRASCGNAITFNNFIKNGVVLRYYYSDKAGHALTSFDVTRVDCGV